VRGLACNRLERLRRLRLRGLRDLLARRSAEIGDRVRDFWLDTLIRTTLLIRVRFALVLVRRAAVLARIACFAVAVAPIAPSAAPAAPAPPASFAAFTADLACDLGLSYDDKLGMRIFANVEGDCPIR
jgi:hypothetical protein